MGDISREVAPSQSEGAEGVGRKVDGRREVLDGRAVPMDLDPADRLGGAVVPGAARVSESGEREDQPSDNPSPGASADDGPEWEPVDAEGGEAPNPEAPNAGPELEGTDLEGPEFEGPEDEGPENSAAAEPDQAKADADGEDAEPAAAKPRSGSPLPDVPPIEGIDHLSRVLLTLLLAAREGASLLRLAQSCDVSQKAVAEGLDHLAAMLGEQDLPLELSRSGDHVRLLSRPETFPYLQRLRGVKKTERLSQAALETLAVIAYRQPVIRAEIEAIRGVKAGPILRTLLDHKLVSVTGRADVPGRPLQYGTTQEFLERFGLSSLKDLPSVKEFKQLG